MSEVKSANMHLQLCDPDQTDENLSAKNRLLAVIASNPDLIAIVFSLNYNIYGDVESGIEYYYVVPHSFENSYGAFYLKPEEFEEVREMYPELVMSVKQFRSPENMKLMYETLKTINMRARQQMQDVA